MFEQISVNRLVSGKGTDLLLQGDGSKPHPVLDSLTGKAQVVYVDPPFMTGEVFMRRRRFGTSGWRDGQPNPQYQSYDDRFADKETYLTMLRGLVTNARKLLTTTGMFCLHLDWRTSHWGRMLCDEIFGEENFVNEIIWAYESGGRSRKFFPRKHDVVLMYAASPRYRFKLEKVPLARAETRRNHMKRAVDEEGRAYRSIRVGGKEYRYYDDEPVYPGDVWTDISHLQQRDPERTGFPTQKPVKLLDRLLRPLTEPGDLVVDLCCGSGTTLDAAQQLGCRVLGMDSSAESLLIAQSRLNTADLTVSVDIEPDTVCLDGTCVPEICVFTLAGMDVQHPSFPKVHNALDTVERWYAGYVQDDTLIIQAQSQRTLKAPEIQPMGLIPPQESTVAIAIVDAAGKCRVFRWV